MKSLNNMKKPLVLLLALALLLSPAGRFVRAEEAEFTVGHTTAMMGNFLSDAFDGSTADMDVRALIHGCNLISWNQGQGKYTVNPTVVDDMRILDDANGNRTYYLGLRSNLHYSDGSAITAWDYAFSFILAACPEMGRLGARTNSAPYIMGWREYAEGLYPALTGIEVLDDTQLAITLDHAYLPCFFELSLLMCEPLPISVIAPGCRVYDDGYGVYVGNDDISVTENLFTEELLRQTVMNPETGYNSHPTVSSGPYVLTDFDGVTAHFQINPYYKGCLPQNLPHGVDAASAELIKPTIQRICFTQVYNDTMIDQLIDGELQLVNKVAYAPAIAEGVTRGVNSGLRYANYQRAGMSMISFSCDWPTVREPAVRQAIAWCMDRDAITQDYCMNFGTCVDGYYGVAQWEYQLISGRSPLPAQRGGSSKIWEGLSLDGLTHYTVDIDRANQLLDESGWTLNRQGEDYRPGEDDVRCKFVDGALIALDLTMMYPEGNHIAESFERYFIGNLAQCGISLTLEPMDMVELLLSYHRDIDRTTDMIYLATNSSAATDPSAAFSTQAREAWNDIYSDDEELYRLAQEMRCTNPGDTFDYVSAWLAFQQRFNEVLPALPIYSNVYFDFFTDQLEDYDIASHVSWAYAIQVASLSGSLPQVTPEPTPSFEIWEDTEEAEESDDGDDVMEFDD